MNVCNQPYIEGQQDHLAQVPALGGWKLYVFLKIIPCMYGKLVLLNPFCIIIGLHILVMNFFKYLLNVFV
jgi:hypothetical protein